LLQDVDDGKYEIKWTAKDAKDESHKKAVRYLQKELPEIKEKLKTFTTEIFAKGKVTEK
jgi:transposase